MEEPRQPVPEVGRTSQSANIQDVDHYDFINAPQYVDFADLAQSDDPNADVFFETHREEDDFLIAIENINPSIQLLNEQEMLHSNENKVNSAACDAGMEDVKVVYYSSPSGGNMKGTAGGRKTTSMNSTVGSFHTPVGEDDGHGYNDNQDHAQDHHVMAVHNKENFAPSPEPAMSIVKSSFPCKGLSKPQYKKLSYSSTTSCEGTAGKRKSQEGKSKANPDAEQCGSSTYSKPLVLRDSLLAKLDNLTIMSSDDEDATAEIIEESCYYSPTETPTKTDQSMIDTLLNTPGAIKPKSGKYTTVSSQKLNFFEGLSLDDTCDEAGQIADGGQETLTESECTKNASEEKTDQRFLNNVNNLDEKGEEEFFKNEFPVYNGPCEGENRKQSFLIDHSVGQEVVWGSEEGDIVGEKGLQNSVEDAKDIHLQPAIEVVTATFEVTDRIDILPEEVLHLLGTDDNEENADETLTSSFGTYHDGPMESLPCESQAGIEENGMHRRASSLSDLTKLQASFKPPAKLNRSVSRPRTGLTIPHSPEASKRPSSKCRTGCKTSTVDPASTTSKTHAARASSVKASIPWQKPKSQFVPTIPYKGAVGGTIRMPIKASHYVSLAEAVSKFQKNTPDRFRTLPRSRIGNERSVSCEAKPEGRGRSPSPAPRPRAIGPPAGRSRISCMPPTNSTVNHGSMADGGSIQNHAKSSGVLKKTTIPQPFNLSSAKPKIAVETKDGGADFKFKARPVPKSQTTLSGLKPKAQLKVTQPMAPHFASDDRIRERHEKRAQSTNHSPSASRSTTAQPMQASTARASRIPTAGCGIRAPTPDLPKTTCMKPFSFDQRNKEMLLRKEEKIKKELKEVTKTWEFHANPLPNLNLKLPKKKHIPVTHVEPFHLKSDERGVAYQEALKRTLEEEERLLREKATFHANPPVVLQKPAFEPEHPIRPPLEPMDFHLNTETRAVEREQFDQHLRQKEMEEERQRCEEQARLEELERQEELERRRQLVHKAQPFRPPKPFEVKASARTLTVPQSPAFRPLPSQRRTSPAKNKSESP